MMISNLAHGADTGDTAAYAVDLVADAPSFPLQTLLAPRSIAVVGASPNLDGHTGRTVANLRRTGYSGSVYPVNPKYEDVGGYRCYPSLGALDAPPDAAYILLRADRVLSAVREAADAGARAIVVCTSGFAEEGPAGRLPQQQLASEARRRGSRVLGPNCIGVLNVVDNVVACPTFNITYTYTPGGISIVSQSGGVGVNMLNRAQGRGIGVRALVSVGNECDLDVAELVDALVDDPATKVIVLFLEQVRRGDAFIAAVARARDAEIPVLALKVGTSDAGARSSLGHTGAMAGAHAVFRDVMTQLGVIETGSLDELLDTAHVLSTSGAPRSARLLVVSPSGGDCSYVADRAVRRGLELPDLAGSTHDALAQIMRFGQPTNPLDLTGQVIGDADLLSAVLAVLETDPNFDLVLYATATWGEHDAQRLLPALIDAAVRSDKVAAICSWSARNLTETAEALLREADVPTFTAADDAIAALGLAARAGRLDGPAYRRERHDRHVVRPANMSGVPTEHEVKQFLGMQGLPVSREVVAHDVSEAQLGAPALGWPIVVKQLCEGLVHKSDLGLVRVGIDTPEDLDAAMRDFAAIVATEGLSTHGLLLAELVRGFEVIVGGTRDASFGPVLMVGAGGVLAEHLDDAVFALCPVSRDEAASMIARLRIGRILSGYRGVVHDVTALATLVSDFSRLFAAAPWIDSIDLNPVVVRTGTGGATIVDAALVLDRPDVRSRQ